MFPSGLVRAAVCLFAFLPFATPRSSGADLALRNADTGVSYRELPTTVTGGANSSSSYSGAISTSVGASGFVIIIGPGPWPWPGPIFVYPAFRIAQTFGTPASEGLYPVSLAQGVSRNLVGTTLSGGANGAGTIFQIPYRPLESNVITQLSGFETLHSFDGAANGGGPVGNLVTAPDGSIYGLTSHGGANGAGTIYRWDSNGLTTLYSFGPEPVALGAIPPPSLVNPRALLRAADGTLYGIAERTRSIYTGPIYWLNTDQLSTWPIFQFQTTYVLFKVKETGVEEVGTLQGSGIRLNGSLGEVRLAEAHGGVLYINVEGSIHRFSEGTAITAVPLPPGLHSAGNLMKGVDGKLHGTVFTTNTPGASVFTLDAGDNSITVLPGTLRSIPPALGSLTNLDPILTTETGGLTKTGGGVLVVNPSAGIIADSSISLGTILTLSPGGPTSLVQTSEGTFYGTWSDGTNKDYIFSVLKDGGTNIVHTFDPALGRNPVALLAGTDGLLYGALKTTSDATKFGATFDFKPGTPKVNLPPQVQGDRFTVTESNGQKLLTASVLSNDADPEGKPLRVFRATCNPVGPQLTVKSDGTISLVMPAEGFNSAVTYEVTDDEGGYATGTVQLINQPPVAKNDLVRIAPDGSTTTLHVLQNDRDSDGDALAVVSFSSPRHGTVTKAADGTELYYKPKPGFVATDSFEYIVSDSHGGTATATVRIENAILDVAGFYTAVIGKPNGIGSARLGVSKSGALTGTIQFGGRTLRIRGRLDSDGANFTFRLSNNIFLSVAVNVDLSGPHPRLSLRLDDGNAAIVTALTRRAASAGAHLAGNYTMELPLASGAEANWPQGVGFAVMTLKENGRARIVGRLGDGYPFSTSADLTASGTLPFFARAYHTFDWIPGGLTGTLAFADLKDTDLLGTLTWYKTSLTPYRLAFVNGVPRVIPTGDSASVHAFGSRFSPISLATDTEPLWQFGAMLHMGDGGLAENIKKRFRFIDESNIEIAPVGSDDVRLNLDNTYGLLGGSFLDTANGVHRAIQGVILQKSARATGLFQGPKSTGWMEIESRN